jgi:hypothetical protein
MLILAEGIYLATKLLKVLQYSTGTRSSAMGSMRRWILSDCKRRYFIFRRSIYLDVVTEREAFSLGACSKIGQSWKRVSFFKRDRELYIIPRGSSLEYQHPIPRND